MVAGDCDIWLQVGATDMEELQTTLASWIGGVPGVRRSDLAFLITRELKNVVATPTSTAYSRLGVCDALGSGPESRPKGVDNTDLAIIDLLMDAGRMPATGIALRLGTVSSKTVSRRMGRLLEKGVIALTAVADHRALGYQVIADIGIEAQPGKAGELWRALAEIDQVNYVALVAGDQDVWIQVRAADMEELQEFILSRLHSLPAVRRTRTTLLFTSALKDADSWRIPGRRA